VFCPEQLLRVILAHIHYMPDHWQGNAHRYETRDEFAQLFQYKAVSLASVVLGWGLAPIPAGEGSCQRPQQLLGWQRSEAALSEMPCPRRWRAGAGGLTLGLWVF